MTNKMGVRTKRLGYSLLLGIILITIAKCEDTSNEDNERFVESEIDSLNDATRHRGLRNLGKIVELVTGVKLNDFTGNETEFGKNSLWQGLYQQCSQRPTMACVKSNVFGYLDHSLGLDGDFQLADGMVFTKNKFIENKYDRKLNEIDLDDGKFKPIPISSQWLPSTKGDTGSDTRSGRSYTSESGSGRDISTFEGLSDTLYEKTMRFLQGHDLQLQLPSMFGGAIVRVSPKALEGEGGALIQLEMSPNANAEMEPRLFGKIKEKVKKKLVLAFLALILVVKMIKLKLFFFLPMMIGAGAAKQVLLKVLLFIFPAFAHLFKICQYYQGVHGHGHGHGPGKFHHHHHKIAHHHHHVRVPVPVAVHSHTPHAEYGAPEGHGGLSGGQTFTEDHSYQSAGPPFAGGSQFGGGASFPAGPPGGYAGSPPGGFAGSPPGSFSGSPPGAFGGSPPGAGYPYHRSDLLTQHALQNENELASWGLGANSYKGSYGPVAEDQRLTRHTAPVTPSSNYFPQSHPAYSGPPPVANQSPVRYNTPHGPQNLHNLHHTLNNQNIRLQVLTPSPIATATTVQVKYDPFYSPILQRMDNVFVQLGFNEEPCRERLVCSMYKNPQRFSPHSNLISAELSRDSQELQKPSVSNSAVARFHRYVESARKGQDRGDCIRLYPACTVNTE